MTAAKKARSSTRRTNASTKPIAKTAGRSSVKSSAISTARRSPPADAIELLTRDHREAKHMFEAYEQLVQAGADADERQALAQEICEFLTLHATIEEELLYPPAREALADEADLIDEATVEHASADMGGRDSLAATFDIFFFGFDSRLDGYAKRTGLKVGPDTLEPVILSVYQAAKEITPARFLAAMNTANTARRKLGAFYAKYDIWLSPTTARVPVRPVAGRITRSHLELPRGPLVQHRECGRDDDRDHQVANRPPQHPCLAAAATAPLCSGSGKEILRPGQRLALAWISIAITTSSPTVAVEAHSPCPMP